MDNDLKKILLILAEKKRFIVIISSILSLIGLTYLLFFYQPDFTSTSKIYLSDKQSNQLSVNSASLMGFRMPFAGGSATSQLSVMGQIASSSSFLESLLNEEIKIDSSNVSTLHKWLNPDLDKNINDHEYKVNSIMTLNTMINVSENYESSIIQIQVTTKSSHASQSINELLVSRANELLIKKENEEAENKLLFIDQRIKDVQKELEASENNLKDFRYKNININSSPDLQMQLDKLMRDVAFKTTIMSTLLGEREVSKIQAIENVNSFSTLQEADLPFHASSLRRLFQLILYVFLSVLASIGYILANIFYNNLLNYLKSLNQDQNY
tara:strand:+ start:1903 stop:2880 length:978 start_codon:yes stop_codon:yes gene_type:complete